MVSRMPSLLKSRKAQFFVLSAFAIVSIIYFVSKWMEPYTIIDTSSVVMTEEPFVFNNIVEKAEETIYSSKTSDDLKYNILEYKNFVEEYGIRKGLKITFNISQINFDDPPSGYIFIELSSPRMIINKTLPVSASFVTTTTLTTTTTISTTTTTTISTTTTTLPIPWKTNWQYRKKHNNF